MATGTLIDGIAASEAIDSSGEIFDVKGADITDFLEGRGLLNFEHKGGGEEKSDSGMDIVGRIVFAKKIYGPEDCSTERQLTYWNSIELPFVYIIGRLFDGAGHENAKALAAIINDCVNNKESVVLGFSIEGKTLKKEDNRLLSTICRRVAVTAKPCNRSCSLGLLASQNGKESVSVHAVQKNETDDPLFLKLSGVTEIEFSNPTLNDSDLEKTFSVGAADTAPSNLTQGAAVQAEDRTLKNKFKSALRDWDKTTPLGKFLKHRLPEVSEDFIDDFVNGMGDYKLVAAKNVFKKFLEQAVIEKMLAKAEGPFKEAAFRHKKTGEIFTAGSFHNIEVLPQSEDLDNFDQGFVLHSGAFVDRDQAAKMVGLKGNLQSEDPKTGLSKGFDLLKKELGIQEESSDILQKFQKIESILRKAVGENEVRSQPVVFQDNPVIPGSGRTSDGKKFDILGHTHSHFVVVPEGKANGFDNSDLQRIQRGPSFWVDKFPEAVKQSSIVDAGVHSVPGMTRHTETHDMIHGFDVDQPKKFGDDSSARGYSSYWGKNAAGKHVFVKEDDLDAGEAHKEALFHNVAKDVFGLGQYVPNVAMSFNPKTGKHFAVIEHIQGSHVGDNPTHESEEGRKLLELGDSGELHKLAVMDHVMQNGDRHQHNYLVNNDGMKLIDHGIIFSPGFYENKPHYLEAYEHVKQGLGQSHGDLHDSTKQWILGLNPDKLRQDMHEQGVDSIDVDESVRRLGAMQEYVRNPPVFEPTHGIENLMHASTGAIMTRK